MLYDVIDRILSLYLQALEGGFIALHQYSLLILGTFAIMAWCARMWGAMLAQGETGLQAALLEAVKIGIWYWVSIFLGLMAIDAFDSFVQLGGASSGGSFGAGDFLVPSRVWGLGWEAARPLLEYAHNFYSVTGIITNLWMLLIVWMGILVLLTAFFIMSLFVMAVQIEFRLAIMLGAVLIPLGVYQGTAFLADFGLGLLCSGLIRVFVVVALLGISLPLIELLGMTLTQGTDPSVEDVLVLAFVSITYVALLITASVKASRVAVHGMGLGIGGEAFSIRNLATAGSMVFGGAIRGVSRLVGR